MESQFIDKYNVKSQKGKGAIVRFNQFRRIAKSRQIFQVLAVFGLISWSSARVPAVMKTFGEYLFVRFRTCFFNHHVVFFIGNAIIVSLFTLCRQNDAGNVDGAVHCHDDYLKHRGSHRCLCSAKKETTPSAPVNTEDATDTSGGDKEEEKQILIYTDSENANAIPDQCDNLTAAIEEATKQINKFQRTQSEKLKREIAVRQLPELSQSKTENYRKTVTSFYIADIENLSNEEFRRTVDAFIDKHWSKKKSKLNKFPINCSTIV